MTTISKPVCIPNNNFCSPGFRLVDSRCISETCRTFSKTTGLCLSCISPAFSFSAGQCLPVNCGNSSYYSAKISNCTAIPRTCKNFSIVDEVCYSCVDGYSLYNGDCTIILNSNNCQIYNFAAGVCITCNSGFQVLNGRCILTSVCPVGQVLSNGVCIVAPANCNQNQVLINNQCADLPKNCLALNVFLQCTTCSANSQFVSGACVACTGPNPNFPCLTCPSGMYVDNQGRCQPVNQFCASLNTANGLCLSCINGQSSVMGNCCDITKTYQNGVCVVQQTSPNNNNGGSSSTGNTGNSGNTGNTGNSGNSGNSGSGGTVFYGPFC